MTGWLELTDSQAADASVAGGKAAALARALAAGLPVPTGLVVPSTTESQALSDTAAAIANRWAGSRLAVRSSGIAEDLPTASYAGQYETVLNVPADPAAIVEAIKRVRASATASHLDTYAPGGERPMAVLAMPMIQPLAAGIAFTRNPITGADEVVVEATAGLADRLAAGEATGESWIVRDGTVTSRPEGSAPVMTEAQVERVAQLARDAERLAGHPVDIEWAIDDGGLWLLQTRPITTASGVTPIPIEEPPPPGPWQWDSTHSRYPMTPLGLSVFTPGFTAGSRRLVTEFGAPFDRLEMTAIGGYIYIQVVPPLGKAGSKPPPAPLFKLLFRLVPALRARERTAREALRTNRAGQLVHQWRSEVAPRVDRTLLAWAEADPSSQTDHAASARLAEAAALQREVFGWNMATDPAYLLPLAELLDFVRNRLGEGMATVTRLLAGSSPSGYQTSVAELRETLSPETRQRIESGMRMEDLAGVDRAFHARFEQHLARQGMRVLGFDLDHPTLGEHAEAELDRIVGAVVDPGRRARDGADECAAELRARLEPDEQRAFDTLLAAARAAYPIREEGESVHARVMGAVRLAALEVGRRLVHAGHLTDPADVLYLTLEEATGWTQQPQDFRETVRVRRGRRAWAALQRPEPVVGGIDTPPDPSRLPPAIARIMRMFSLVIEHDAQPAQVSEGADGVGASPGRYTGPARVVCTPAEFHRIQPGDVLIAPITTSPWEVVFPQIGAMVTEGGGLLSHPAIVAREYGLPAVVGCEGATERFSDGELVTVDGTAGTVVPVSRVQDGVAITPHDNGREA